MGVLWLIVRAARGARGGVDYLALDRWAFRVCRFADRIFRRLLT